MGQEQFKFLNIFLFDKTLEKDFKKSFKSLFDNDSKKCF